MKKGNASYRARGFLSRVKEASKEKGIRYVALAGVNRMRRMVIDSFWCYYYSLFKSWSTFTFQGKNYKYFYHRYNTTWRNERAVEIPIIWHIVKTCEWRSVLEVGNVLSHYFTVNHDIVDKYEKAEGVISQDVTEIRPSKKYDLIISISTLEHVGWDENPGDHRILHESKKITYTIDVLKRLLTSKGEIVVTLPLGYNPYLDKLLKSGEIKFDDRFYLKRISKDNRWIEVSWKDVERLKYNGLIPSANGLIIGVIKSENKIKPAP
ncbi:MAG: hypothetical protein OEY22_06395 [Candidatus Bathyarchaeota archaeon]|nr:hypothetical protein [Candidatus Bathyarchaeota archaeon]